MKLYKFTDDTKLLGLVSNDDERAYRDMVGALVEWSRVNNLSLNIGKTKELVGHSSRQKGDLVPQTISGVEVDRVASFKFHQLISSVGEQHCCLLGQSSSKAFLYKKA